MTPRRPLGFLMPLFALALVAVLSTPSAVRADEPVREKVYTLSVDAGGKYNPDGAELDLELRRRWRLSASADPESLTYADLGVGTRLNPAAVAYLAFAEWQPHPAFNLRLQYDFYQYFGDNTGLLSFPTSRSKYGPSQLDDLKGREESTTAQRVLLRPTLSVKVGRVIMRNVTDLAYYRFEGDGPYVLELDYDILMKKDDFLVSDRFEAVHEVWKGKNGAALMASPFYEIRYATAAGLSSQRVGVSILAIPAERIGFISNPRIYLQGGTYLHDPNIGGQMFIGGGVGCDIDF